MNRIKSWILRCWLIPCIVLATSCIDVREEFWIHQDGSAEAEITCQMPRAATLALGGPDGVERMVDKLLSDEPGIDDYQVHVFENPKSVTLKVHCSVEELLAFDRLRKSIQKRDDLHPAMRKMMGEFNIGLEGISGVSVTRTVAPGEAVPALRWLPKSQTDGHGFTKILHFPHPVKTHNAHDCWDDGCTLMWETSLASAVKTPMRYEFVMPVPLPWGWIGGGVAALITVTVLVLLRLKSRTQKQGKP